MRNLSNKCRRGHQHTFYLQYHIPENGVVYEVTFQNMAQPERPQVTK